MVFSDNRLQPNFHLLSIHNSLDLFPSKTHYNTGQEKNTNPPWMSKYTKEYTTSNTEEFLEDEF